MNYAYLRYLAVKGFEGTVKTKTAVTVNGRLCKAIYVRSVLYEMLLNEGGPEKFEFLLPALLFRSHCRNVRYATNTK